jgi:hypothetical protein
VSRIPWWALASAVAAPVLLIGGWTIAAMQQPYGYNPISDTISSLAAQGATDRGVMTTALAGLGACYVITAAGLRPARVAGRLVLACGGLATLLVAAFPQPVRANSIAHSAAAAIAFTAVAAWPVFGARHRPCAPLLTHFASGAATVFLLGLVLWLVFELHGGHRGLAERAAAGMEALWPLAVVVTSGLMIAPAPQP